MRSSVGFRRCLDALFLTDPRVDRERLESIKGSRVAGTCEWIQDDEMYQKWPAGDDHLLWISGSPGKGKTMLSMFLIEDLERAALRDGSVECLYYFCDHEDAKRNTGTAVLRSLLYQMLVKHPGLFQHIASHFETTYRVYETVSCLEALWVCFQDLVLNRDWGQAVCVLDGLDECLEPSQGLLIWKLVKLFAKDRSSSGKIPFKLIILSRDILDLRDCPRVDLDT